jgi:hypothetical protein
MPLLIHWNDAWESVPLEYADKLAVHLKEALHASHPLRKADFFPVAKLCRQRKYLLEVTDKPEQLWLLDMHKKKRIKGKTCHWFRHIESQEELDGMLSLTSWIRPSGKKSVAQVVEALGVFFICQSEGPVVKTRSLSAGDFFGIVAGQDVSALHQAEEKRQGAPLLEHRREQARRRRFGRAAPRTLPRRD